MWVHNFITYDMSCEQVVVKIMIMVLLEKNYLLKKKKKKKNPVQCQLCFDIEKEPCIETIERDK